MKNRYTIGISGGSGSGKTTLARMLIGEIGSTKAFLIQQDNYYKDQSSLPLEMRNNLNFDCPEAFDNDLFCKHIRSLVKGRPVQIPLYDFSTHTRTNRTERIFPKYVIILEGLFLFNFSSIWDLMDLKIFMDTDPDLRFIRRLVRDTEERGRNTKSVIDQYIATVKPMHDKFVEPYKKYADIIVSGNGEMKDSIKVILSKIASE